MGAKATLDERLHVTRSRARPGGTRVVEGRPFRDRKPPWFKVRAPGSERYRNLKGMIEGERLPRNIGPTPHRWSFLVRKVELQARGGEA